MNITKIVSLICFFCLRVFAFTDSNGFQSTEFQRYNIQYFSLDNTYKIALTFDDGPGKGTEKILNLLKKYDVKATFFVLGNQVKNHAHLTRRIVSEGHLLANHSYTHPQLAKDSYRAHPELLLEELKKTHTLIKPYLNEQNEYYFRAPYASWSEDNAKILNQDPELRKYIGPVCWDVGRKIEIYDDQLIDAADWECWDKSHRFTTKECASGYFNALENLKGGVVLMHDIHLKTADMLEILLPELIQQGYSFVTLEQIQELKKYDNESGDFVYQPQVDSISNSQYKGRCLLKKKPTMSL